MRRGGEVAEQRLVVEREVRRPDHGDTGRAGRRRMLGQRDRVGRRLRAAVGDHRQLAGGERREHLLPLGDREQDPLAGRAEREDAVDAAGREERRVRRDRLEVGARTVVGERRECGGDRSSSHGARC